MSEPSRVCVVSGGSSGVGLATAFRFAGNGYRIAICGRRPEPLTEAHDAISDKFGADHVLAVQADMSLIEEATGFIDQAIQQFGRIDVLVNNAAMAPLAPIDEMQDQQIDACIDLNVRGIYYATRSAWRQMKQQGSGVIVNISSQAAVDPFPGFTMYGATKAWAELFTVALANEGAQFGIRAYCIRPGAIETPMLRGLFPDFPAEQCVSAREVATEIWNVCQADSDYNSGQAIPVSRQ